MPHHLLNVVGPDEDFTAAVFKKLANQVIADITARGKLPIMVGGTGLYVDGVIYDFNFLPVGDRAARQGLNELSVTQLLRRIKTAGLKTDNIDINNKRRLIRLIETNGARPIRHNLRPNTLLMGLKTDHETLKQRVTERVDAMLVAGLEDEVRRLVERYGWDCEALKGISYAQWQGYFLGTESLEQTRQKIIKATLDLAKRQRTWFKRNQSIHWLTTPVNWREVVDLVTTFLTSDIHT